MARLNRFALAEIRERSGLSKSQLAVAAARSTSTISDLESGRRDASPELLRAIADALKCPLAALLASPEERSA